MAVITFDLASVAKDDVADVQTYGLATSKVLRVRAASTGEIAKFSNAVSAVEMEELRGQSRIKSVYLSATALATVKTAINA